MKNGRKAGLRNKEFCYFVTHVGYFPCWRSNSGLQQQNFNASKVSSIVLMLCEGQQRSNHQTYVLSLLSCSIPGVFPESPRWLLLSERSADMNSFSERRNSNRDDESFTGVTGLRSLLSLTITAAQVFFATQPSWMDFQCMKPALFMGYLLQCISKHEYITDHDQEQVMMLNYNSWFIKYT